MFDDQMLWETPKIAACKGTEKYPLPQDKFPKGVDMTEYYQKEKLLGAVCRFQNNEGNCTANEIYSTQTETISCKYCSEKLATSIGTSQTI
ncbi:MAG: hypothetical protein WC916_04020 [Candidatus Woesearchaeota archaeon]